MKLTEPVNFCKLLNHQWEYGFGNATRKCARCQREQYRVMNQWITFPPLSPLKFTRKV